MTSRQDTPPLGPLSAASSPRALEVLQARLRDETARASDGAREAAEQETAGSR